MNIYPAIVPTASFPTQLTQAVLAVKHVLASGIQPKNLQIVGDSAGGNLVVQLLSHILHPVDNVPLISLPAPIRGIYLMSPWLSMCGATGSHITNDGRDVVSAKTFAYCGRKVLAGVPESHYNYLEASKSPDGWFEGVAEVVDHVLITAGSNECLMDDIQTFAGKFCVHHAGAEFIVHEKGVHNDPYYDFLVAERRLSNLTPLIIDWLAGRFA